MVPLSALIRLKSHNKGPSMTETTIKVSEEEYQMVMALKQEFDLQEGRVLSMEEFNERVLSISMAANEG